jgi:hypothetical protein
LVHGERLCVADDRPVGVGSRLSALIVTKNLSFGEWSTVFGDAKMTTALLDCGARQKLLGIDQA